MRIFKTREFARLIRKTDITDEMLRLAVQRAGKGLVDAHLGSGLIKQRIGRPGQGRSGGYRSIIALRVNDRAIFLHCFAKNDQANIADAKVRALRELAVSFLNFTDGQIEYLIKARELVEVKDDA